jgi:hypothetical protein
MNELNLNKIMDLVKDGDNLLRAQAEAIRSGQANGGDDHNADVFLQKFEVVLSQHLAALRDIQAKATRRSHDMAAIADAFKADAPASKAA